MLYCNLQGQTGKWRASANRTICGAKATCILGMLLAMFVFLAVGLAVGLFVGHSIGKRSSDSSKCLEPTTQHPVTQHLVTIPPPANMSRQYNWGDKVKVGEKEVNVVDWVDGVMQAENIRNNLEWVQLVHMYMYCSIAVACVNEWLEVDWIIHIPYCTII